MIRSSLWPPGGALALWVASTLALATPRAQASTFDPETGQLSLDGSALTVGFEADAAPAVTVRAFGGGGGGPLDAASLEALYREEALEGGRALELGGPASVLTIDLAAAAETLGDRRVRLSFWQRGRGLKLRGYIGWWSDPAPITERLDFSAGHRLSLVRFLPSGRATSDGWVEYTSGPIDFRLGGRMDPIFLVQPDVDDLHGVSAPDPAARVLIDAIEVQDLGPAAVPDAACSVIEQATQCGALGACYLGRCADHAAVFGPVFERVEDRRAYVERRLFEVETFAGHQGARAGLPGLQAALREAAEGPEARFWPAVQTAWLDLADGHASPMNAGYSAPPSIGLCFTQGQADLLPGSPEVPLVFDKGAFHPEVGPVNVGDALVAIDGVPVAEWRQHVRHWSVYNGDPDNAAYVESLQLARVAALAGARLSLARCAGPEACTPDEVETVILDLGEVLAPFWQGEAPPWLGPQCDGRFSRLSGPNDGLNSVFATSRVQDDVTVLMINAVPGTFQPGWQGWFAAVDAAFATDPARVLLDQRIGNGGGFESVARLTGYLDGRVQDSGFFLMPWLQDLEGDASRFDPLAECARAYPSTSAFLWCGGSRWDTPSPDHPGPGRADAARLAVLNGRDVSGNDFTSHLFARRTGPTRIFGPGPTFGAFGMIMSLPEHGVGISGGGLQATDGTIVLGPMDPLDARLSGPGIPPDEVVLQKQSDALRGVDTMMEVARAWLRQ